MVLLVETLHGAVVPVLRLRWNGRDQLEGLTSESLLELDEADRVGNAREGVEGDRGVLPLPDPEAVASEDLRGLAFAVEDRGDVVFDDEGKVRAVVLEEEEEEVAAGVAATFLGDASFRRKGTMAWRSLR